MIDLTLAATLKPKIELRDVKKSFGGNHVLNGVSLRLRP